MIVDRATGLPLTDIQRTIYNSLPVSIVIYEPVRDDSGGIVAVRADFVNQLAMQTLNWPGGPLPGRHWQESFYGPATNGALERLKQVIQSGEPDRFALRIEAPALVRPVWYDLTIAAIDGHALVCFNDITTHKETETSRHQQADLLQKVLDNAPTGIVLYEPVRNHLGQISDFRFGLSNQMNGWLSGHTADQLARTTLLTINPDSRENGLFSTLKAVVESGEPEQGLLTYLVNGVSRWYETLYLVVDEGVLVIYLDVTVNKQVQADQKQQADLFRAVVEHAPAGLILFSPVRASQATDTTERIIDFTYTLVNPTGAQSTNRPVDELIGKRLLVLYPNLKDSPFFINLVAVAVTGEPRQFLTPYLNDDLSGWLDCRQVAQEQGVLCTYLDVTEQYAYQQQLELANQQLRRSQDTLRQFSYVASHDLQEPLRKIQAFSDLLTYQYAASLDGNAADLVGRMQTSAARMSLLIKDVSAYSRIAVQLTSFQPVALADTIATVVQGYRQLIEDSNARIRLADLPVIWGDAGQLYQLFDHLLGNALKFRQPGVQPLIRVSSRRMQATEAGPLPDRTPGLQAPPHSFYEISLEDNGIGFEPTHNDRIFGMFQRLHTQKQYSGSGVGLPIARKIAENHGGRITAAGVAGQGATFRVYLPIR